MMRYDNEEFSHTNVDIELMSIGDSMLSLYDFNKSSQKV